MADDWAPGCVIAERYRLVDLVARGGMGAVWRAEHISLGSQIALKQIDRELLGTPQAISRFLREAKAVASLRSPHVVHVFDHGIDSGIPFMAMELLEGGTLAERLDGSSALIPLHTLRIVTHVARALRRAHEAGIVHRDLKPENIFLVTNEDEEIAKVIDFGIAKLAAVEGTGLSTETGSLLGTPVYMSPEQARGRKVDLRTDLWSLAVITFECLCGKRPFDGETVGDIIVSICSEPIVVPSSIARVPRGFDAWFARGVARDPEERFQSARELVSALRTVITGSADAHDETSGTNWRLSDPSLPTLAHDAQVIRISHGTDSLGSTETAPALTATPELERRVEELGEGPRGRTGLVSSRHTARRMGAIGAVLAGITATVVGLGLMQRSSDAPEPPKATDPPPSSMPPAASAPADSAARVEPVSGLLPAPESAAASASVGPSAALPRRSGAAPAPSRKEAPRPQPSAAPDPAPQPPGPKAVDPLAF